MNQIHLGPSSKATRVSNKMGKACACVQKISTLPKQSEKLPALQKLPNITILTILHVNPYLLHNNTKLETYSNINYSKFNEIQRQ